MGLLMNIILGIVGAALLNFVLSTVGIYTGTGLLVYLIIGFIGACLLIAIARLVSPLSDQASSLCIKRYAVLRETA